MHVLSRFDIQDMTALSAEFRGMADGAGCMEEVADRIVRHLYENLVVEDKQQSACALVRMFVTVPYRRLEPDVRQTVDEKLETMGIDFIDPEMTCFTLIASRGHRPEWNSRRSSRHFKVTPIYDAKALDEDPDARYIFDHLGITHQDVVSPDPQKVMALSLRTLSVFFEEHALGSAHIPHQEDFVIPFGVQSKLLLSGILPSGRMFGLVLFPTVRISRDIARLFMPLSMSLKLALMPFDTGRIFVGETEDVVGSDSLQQQIARFTAQVTIMDELLSVHEDVARKRTDQLKKALAELDRSARELKRSNEDLDQFAYVASHDLQEPLRAVTGYLDMLKRKHKDELSEEAGVFVQHAVDGAKRMHALITDLLKYARVNTRGAELMPTDCNKVLDDTLANLKIAIQESGATVDRQALPTVNGDKVQLTQVFQNLIGNAIKFRGERAPVVDVSAVRDDGQWKISIRDNGIGFDMSHADRIFQIFKRLHTRTAYQGTGIGLAICKKIVERHGGVIWAESVPGEGTAFHFTLPSSGI